jgi:hypothetical protein
VKAGVVPTLEAVLRKELGARGIDGKAIAAVPVKTGGTWRMARRLREWLAEHPEASVTFLCPELHSRRTAYVTRGVLGKDLAERVRWRAFPDERFTTSNWWKSRQGIVEVVGAWIALAHAYLGGEPPETAAWDPDQYEQSLRSLPGR